MNVLVITSLYPNKADPGRAPYNRQQVRALAQHAHMRVVAPVFWTAPGARGVAAAGPEEWDGVEVHHPLFVYPPRLGRASHGLCYSVSLAATLKRLWRERPWDVVYGTFLFPDGHAAVRAARRFGRPCVLKAHGSDVNEVARHPLRRFQIRRAVDRAAAVVAVSRALCRGLAALGAREEKIRLLYNGVDTKAFRPMERAWARRVLGLPEGDPMVLYVGNLKRAKGAGVLVEALARLAGAGRAPAAAIVGDGPYRGALEAALRAHRLEGRVRLAGSVPHDEVATWYAAADLVCLPSLMEGVPNVVLEALACGRPVVASAVGGIPEVLDEACGVLVPAGDPAALADALGRVVAAPWDAAALAGRVAHRSWETNGRSLARILAEAAGGGV